MTAIQLSSFFISRQKQFLHTFQIVSKIDQQQKPHPFQESIYESLIRSTNVQEEKGNRSSFLHLNKVTSLTYLLIGHTNHD